MDPIVVLDAACRLSVQFDNLDVAVGFLRMMAHVIAPANWLDVVKDQSPDLLDNARAIVERCFGVPA